MIAIHAANHAHQSHVAANQDHVVQSQYALLSVSQDTTTTSAATKMQFACHSMRNLKAEGATSLLSYISLNKLAKKDLCELKESNTKARVNPTDESYVNAKYSAHDT